VIGSSLVCANNYQPCNWGGLKSIQCRINPSSSQSKLLKTASDAGFERWIGGCTNSCDAPVTPNLYRGCRIVQGFREVSDKCFWRKIWEGYSTLQHYTLAEPVRILSKFPRDIQPQVTDSVRLQIVFPT